MCVSEEIHLRHVEKDVLIPQLMREKAKERCDEIVQGVCVSERVSVCACMYVRMYILYVFD